MTERPIIFSAEMIHAILDGRKTVTRRLVKNFPERKCPYGVQGDRLWVRENFRLPEDMDGLSMSKTAAASLEAGYTLPWSPIQYEADDRRANWASWRVGKAGRLRPSIHMPRWACRITLDVVSIRCEWLLTIADADAVREGVADRAAFMVLWDKLHGPESSADNPSVWRIEFKRVME